MQTKEKLVSPADRIRRAVTIVAAVAAIACGVFAAGQPARAQTPPNNNKISLDFQNAPITKVLQTLFKSAGNINNSIDPDVQGTVTVNLTDVSFDVALRSLLNSTLPPLTYDVASGVYHIKVKRDLGPTQGANLIAPPVAPTEKTTYFKLPIFHYDPISLVPLLSGTQPFAVLGPNYVIASGGGQGGQGGQGGFGGGGLGGGGGGFGGGGLGGGGGGFGGGGLGGGGGFGGGGGGRSGGGF